MDTKALVKSPEEIDIMRAACQKLARVFEALEEKVVPGANAMDVDRYAEEMIHSLGSVPAFKGYDSGGHTPFPATICFSRNDAIVHGIPTEDDVITATDVASIDMGLIYRGHYADMARTFVMPEATEVAKQLALHTQKTFEVGVAQIKDGALLSDYACAAQDYAEGKGYKVIRNLVGHGIGKELHMPPQIPNYHSREFVDFTFRAGMTVAIEPMVTIGSEVAETGPDGWTLVTDDGSLAAHYENTLLVTDDGCEILTRA